MAPEIRRSARFVFLLALVVRLAWCAFATVTPLSDASGYDQMARGLLQTGRVEHGEDQAWRTPGYPGFIAGVYAVCGENWRVVGLVQAVLGALSAALVVGLAGLVVSPRASLLAGILQALWPTSVVYTPVLISENLATPLLLLTLVGVGWARRAAGARSLLRYSGAGLIFGALLLARPAGCFVAPALLVLLLYDGARCRWQPLAAFAAATLVVLGPWLARNARLGLGPCTLSTEGGLALWWGNNPDTRDGASGVVRFPEDDRLAELGRDRFYWQKAGEWMRTNPGRYVALCRVRALRFWGTRPDWFAAKFAWPTADNDQAVQRRFASVSAEETAPSEEVRYAAALEARHMKYEERLRRVVAPLILVAFAWSLVRWSRFALVSLPALFYFVGLSLTVFLERFRVVSDPLLLILLAALLADVFFGALDLRGHGVPRYVPCALAVVSIAASFLLHGTRLDKNWYELPRGPTAETRAACGAPAAADALGTLPGCGIGMQP